MKKIAICLLILMSSSILANQVYNPFLHKFDPYNPPFELSINEKMARNMAKKDRTYRLINAYGSLILSPICFGLASHYKENDTNGEFEALSNSTMILGVVSAISSLIYFNIKFENEKLYEDHISMKFIEQLSFNSTYNKIYLTYNF